MRSYPVVLPLALAACVHDVAPAELGEPVDPEVALGAVEANLARWNALEVVTAEDLAFDLSEYTGDCYGMPCGAAFEEATAAEREESAIRLAGLVALAEALAPEAPERAYDPEVAAADVARLRALEIVSLADFEATEPVVTGNCYGACPEDVAVAEADTAERAARLHAIADEAVRALGPESE